MGCPFLMACLTINIMRGHAPLEDPEIPTSSHKILLVLSVTYQVGASSTSAQRDGHPSVSKSQITQWSLLQSSKCIVKFLSEVPRQL